MRLAIPVAIPRDHSRFGQPEAKFLRLLGEKTHSMRGRLSLREIRIVQTKIELNRDRAAVVHGDLEIDEP
jgi:hypothetical protein